MSKRARRSSGRRGKSPLREEVSVTEGQVPASFNQSLPSEGDRTLPARILDQFSFHSLAPDGSLQPQSLTSLSDGLAAGWALQASGFVLDPRLASTSLADAQGMAYVRLHIEAVQDWCFDYSQHHMEPHAVWIITSTAWYRLATPSQEHLPLWQPVADRLALASCCYTCLAVSPLGSFEEAVNRILHGGLLAGIGGSPQKRSKAAVIAALAAHAGFLASHLAVCLGRHAQRSGLLQELARRGGVELSSLADSGRPLLTADRSLCPPADPSRRPAPRTDFAAPAALVPGLLMVWDFCQSLRQLLRLPPFPFSRLEEAFAEPGAGQERESWYGTALLRDVHLSLLRVVEGRDLALLEPPTMAGYGSAAELGPQQVYRPLLSGSWPELVRAALLPYCSYLPDSPAAAACAELLVTDYSELGAEQRLALLQGLIHIASDSEAVRGQYSEGGVDAIDERLPRGLPIGCDETGTSYHLLGADSGKDRLFVEVRQKGQAEEQAGTWGWYPLEDVPGVVEWLEGGCQSEAEVGEDIFQAFQPQRAALDDSSRDADGEATAGMPKDGYSAVEAEAEFPGLLRREMLGWLDSVRFWERSSNWLQAQAAVAAEVRRATTPQVFARLLLLTEDLVYVDLLKGTGWGRRRNWCKDQLEACRTMAQAAVVAAGIATHVRPATELGMVSLEGFKEALKGGRAPPGYIPTLGSPAVYLKSGYAAHIQQARPPKDALAWPLPPNWGVAEHIVVKQMKYALGSWQRPGWQGRLVGGSAPPHADGEDLLMVCMLVERQPKAPAPTPPKDAQAQGDINWENFSFQTGFRQAQPLPGGTAPVQEADGVKGAEQQATAGSVAVKVEAPDAKPPGVPVNEAAEAKGLSKVVPTANALERVQQQTGVPSGRSTPEAGGSGLRRSGRVRTETPMHDYEAGTDYPEGGHSIGTRSRRGPSSDFYATQAGYGLMQPAPVTPQSLTAVVDPEDGMGVDSTPFWRRTHDVAALLFYIRKQGLPSVEYLVKPVVYNPNVARTWAEGTLVKMPAYSTLERALSIPGMRWYSGVTTSTFHSLTEPQPGKQTAGDGAAQAPLPKASATASQPGVPPAPQPAAPVSTAQAAGTSLPSGTSIAVEAAKPEPAEAQTSAAMTTAPPALLGASGLPNGAPRPAAPNPPVSTTSGSAPGAATAGDVASVRPPGGFSALLGVANGNTSPSPSPRPAGAALLRPPNMAQMLGPRPRPQASSQGVRLSELVPPHAARGLEAGYVRQPSGGPGGARDPWKALPVRWDFGTPNAWPVKVSPWEVVEDEGGAVRKENGRLYAEMLAKQRMAAAATQRPAARPQNVYYPLTGGGATRPNGAPSYTSVLQQACGAASGGGRYGTSGGASTLPPYSQPQFRPFTQIGGLQNGLPMGPQFVFRPNSAVQGTPFPAAASQAPQAQVSATGFKPLVQPPPASLQPQLTSRPSHSPSPTPEPGKGTKGGAKRTRKRTSSNLGESAKASEQNRERWQAKKPRLEPSSWLSGLCSACEKPDSGGALLHCMGPCLRSYHPACVGAAQQGPADGSPWFCPECDSGCMRCFVCGVPGAGIDDSSVRKCSQAGCGRFYHIGCVDSLPHAKVVRNTGQFRCPQHSCATCESLGDGSDIIRCIRCPTAYHSACLTSTAIRRLDSTLKVILCRNHDPAAPAPGYPGPPRPTSFPSRDPRLPPAAEAHPAATQPTQPDPPQISAAAPALQQAVPAP